MGSQRQPGVRTVESDTIASLKRIGAISSVTGSRFRFASRTDRGVSALGNVLAFDTDFDQRSLLKAINAFSDDIFYYAWAEVPANFVPRRAKGRWYRYLLPNDGIDVQLMCKAAKMFEGRHDFRRFCKVDGRGTMKTIDSIDIITVSDMIVIDLHAREFLRNMVRRMVSAMSEVGKGRADMDEINGSFNGEDGSFGLAPAEGLTLMDVDYGFDFNICVPNTLLRKAREYRRDAFYRLAFIEGLPIDQK